MTGTIWTVGGSESVQNRTRWPSVNARRQVTIWQGFLDADYNGTLDYSDAAGWNATKDRIEAQYGIDDSYPDMIGPDLEYGDAESGWTAMRVAGPTAAGFDNMVSETNRHLRDCRLTWPNAEHIKCYGIPEPNTWSHSVEFVRDYMEKQRVLIERCQEHLTCLFLVSYRDREKASWNIYYRKAVEYLLDLSAQFDLVPVVHVGYRITPNSGQPERFALQDLNIFTDGIREVIKEPEYNGLKCQDIGVWDQAKWEWGVCQRTNADGSWKVTTHRQNILRDVLTAELIAAGVLNDPIGTQQYWDETAMAAYRAINEGMDWEMPSEVPSVPISDVELIAESAAGVTESIERANAYGEDAAQDSRQHRVLINTIAERAHQ